jgi:hypothetical protein
MTNRATCFHLSLVSFHVKPHDLLSLFLLWFIFRATIKYLSNRWRQLSFRFVLFISSTLLLYMVSTAVYDIVRCCCVVGLFFSRFDDKNMCMLRTRSTYLLPAKQFLSGNNPHTRTHTQRCSKVVSVTGHSLFADEWKIGLTSTFLSISMLVLLTVYIYTLGNP